MIPAIDLPLFHVIAKKPLLFYFNANPISIFISF